MLNSEYKIEEPKRGLGKIVSLALLLAIILVVVGLVYFFTKINRGTSKDSYPVEISIEAGTSTRDIAHMLNDKDVINNPSIFITYAILSNASSKFQAGDYLLDRKMSISEIVDVLTQGKVTRSDKKITIIEGWSNSQLLNYLETRQLANASQFNKAIQGRYDFTFRFADIADNYEYEGFLFPDTYEISKSAGIESLIEQALKNFDSKFTREMESDLAKRNVKVLDAVIIASIVEKEVGRNLDRPLTDADLTTMQRERELVASVFYNRLHNGMPLQSDATVNYATGKSDRSVSLEDTKIDSLYNTYKFRGLPPGPISNPGLGSLKAAVYPATSDYVYFLNKIDGEAVFSTTLEEHNANKALFLK